MSSGGYQSRRLAESKSSANDGSGYGRYRRGEESASGKSKSKRATVAKCSGRDRPPSRPEDYEKNDLPTIALLLLPVTAPRQNHVVPCMPFPLGSTHVVSAPARRPIDAPDGTYTPYGMCVPPFAPAPANADVATNTIPA